MVLNERTLPPCNTKRAKQSIVQEMAINNRSISLPFFGQQVLFLLISLRNLRLNILSHGFKPSNPFYHPKYLLCLLLTILFNHPASALTGSSSVGKGWLSVVYIEFSFGKDSDKKQCTGFLINDSQVLSAGHCAYKEEDSKKATSAMVCLGNKRPFNEAGEVCLQSKHIRIAKNYHYGSPDNLSLMDLEEKIPLNFLGVTLTKILPVDKASQLFDDPKLATEVKVVSFGSRQFNHPTTAKKGWAKANKLYWDQINHFWKVDIPRSSYGQADDGAGLFVRFNHQDQWFLVGVLVQAKPDFFNTVEDVVDPCAPPQPPPRQPSILLTSQFTFVSIHRLACGNRFLSNKLASAHICKDLDMNSTQLQKLAKLGKDNGLLAYQLSQASSSERDRLKWLNEASAQGNPAAKYQLSLVYKSGLGVKKNTEKAQDLLLTSAELGYPKAQYEIGMKLKQNSSNLKFQKNDLSWLDWIGVSAKAGDEKAQYELGLHLLEIHQKGAYDWFMRSARQGYAPAQYQIASFYQDGFEVKKNTKLAYQWMEYSAGQGYYEAILWLERHPRSEYRVYDDEFE